jgi:uncharacterized protein YdiU (UPF0061 family)
VGVVYNETLAEALELATAEYVQQDVTGVFSGNIVPPNAQPIAQAYAGHQYGHFSMLGDGRAILLGEHLTSTGQRFDIQLKGAGPTAYSRRGDGRAALGPMLREFLVSEAMAALGIPTTRSLAVVQTGDWVMRDKPLQGAVLTRVAKSHLRVGTFEYVASFGSIDELQALVDYTVQRHYPTCADSEYPAYSLLEAVISAQASLIAKWQAIGFVHGVMNTDNMSICGETIDYGPCAFMDTYDPATVFSSIDRHGRYAYGNQPRIAQWNLARLAQALLPLLHSDPENALIIANDAVIGFNDTFQRLWRDEMASKLGVLDAQNEDDDLIQTLLKLMHQYRVDYMQTFRMLSSDSCSNSNDLFQSDAFKAWHTRWRDRLQGQTLSIDQAKVMMRQKNPALIPRNHLVEAVLEQATEKASMEPLFSLHRALKKPFEEIPLDSPYGELPPEKESAYKTYCGT